MDITALLAQLLNPNGSQSILGAPAQAATAVGDHANPALMQAQMARFSQPPAIQQPQAPQMQPQMAQQEPQQQAMPLQAPQGQPMPQSAPQAAPVDQGGGVGDFLTNLFAPKQAAKTRTVGWLQQQGLDQGTATLIASDKGALRSYLLQRSKGGATTEFDQRAQAAQQYGMQPGTPEFNSFVLGGKLPGNENARDKFGNNPVWGKDPKTGKWVLFQLNNAGGLQAAPAPEGVDLVPPGIGQVDLGTSFGIRDRAGDIIGNVPIDNAGKASDTKFGQGQGDARVAYTSMQAKLPGLETVVSQLDDLANKATYTGAGQLLDYGRKELGLSPRDAAVARTTYISTVSNQILPLLRDTFGAQFTAREGDTLVATMGDPDKTPAEKQAALKTFIEQKKRDIAALASQTGQGGSAPSGAAPQGGDTPPASYDGDPKIWQFMTPEQRKLWQQ